MENDKQKKIIAGAGIASGLALLLFLLLKTPPPGLATLHGLVTDAVTGHGIQGINVTLDGYSATTDVQGYYLIEEIAPGTYTAIFADPLGRYETVTV